VLNYVKKSTMKNTSINVSKFAIFPEESTPKHNLKGTTTV
jgi:hypothetical protein